MADDVDLVRSGLLALSVRLLHALRASPDDEPAVVAEALARGLQPASTSSAVAAFRARRAVAERAPKPARFLKRYDELKSRGLPLLDAYVELLARLGDVPDVQARLAALAGDSAESTTAVAKKSVDTEAAGQAAADRDDAPLGDQLPHMPAWARERPFLTMDFVERTDEHGGRIVAPVELATLPVAAQESLVVDDLLHVLVGVEGRYVRLAPGNETSHRRFTVDSTMDVALFQMTARLLPLAAHRSNIARFVSTCNDYLHGTVLQALAAAARWLLREHAITIAQLESEHRAGRLPLARLFYLVQPAAAALALVNGVVLVAQQSLKPSHAATTLTALHQQLRETGGDQDAERLLLYLAQAATSPYFAILERWLCKGEVADPYGEFFIVEDEQYRDVANLASDDDEGYWVRRFSLHADRVPSFLRPWDGAILSIGRHRNAARQLGETASVAEAGKLKFALDNSIREYVEKMKASAGRQLLDRLWASGLRSRLRSAKRYFLLDHGDFLVNFMDLADEELKKPIADVSLPRLRSVLELALRSSSAGDSDSFQDDLRPVLLERNLIEQLVALQGSVGEAAAEEPDAGGCATGLEAFSLDFNVAWPHSLLLSRRILQHYQLLFRHLFYLRHVERQLGLTWLGDRAGSTPRTMEHYVMFEVIEPRWHAFEEKIGEATDVDDLRARHMQLLSQCMEDAMLTRPALLRLVSKLMSICVIFSNYMQKFTHTLGRAAIATPSTEDALEAATARFGDSFTLHHTALLDLLREHEGYEALIARLDYSGFYSSS